VVFAATLVMPGGLGCTIWGAEEYAERYGESGHEPPDLRERFAQSEWGLKSTHFDGGSPLFRGHFQPGNRPSKIAKVELTGTGGMT
jgi:hypothetical protein